MNTSDFNFVFLGQSVLKYKVPLDVFHTINDIYEKRRHELYPANKQLVGKIENEHSLFFDGPPNNKMQPHRHLPDDVMQWYTENPDAFPNRFNLKNDEEKLSMIMNKNGAIAKDLEAIKNAYNYPDICHFVKYDDLVANPEKEFRKIYKFIEEPYYPHYFDNLQTLNVNDIKYDDKIVGSNMHKLFNGPVRKVYNPYIEKIPERIRQKYEHIRF